MRHRPILPPPRPLLFAHDPSFGGMGAGSRFLLDACAQAGIEPRVLELTTPGRDESVQGRLGIASLFHAVELYARFVGALVSRRTTIVYLPIAQWGLPLARDLALVATASLFRVPVVLHLHGSQLAERVGGAVRLQDRVIRRLLRRKTWAVLSPQLRDFLISTGAAVSVSVVRNPAYPIANKPASHDDPDRLRVGFLGLCCTEKGLDILISAVEELRNARGLDVRLVVAGPAGDLVPQPTEWLTYLGKAPRDALETDFWPHVDVLALPARWREGLPFVVLEALQHGKLVIASESLGMAELIDAAAISVVAPSLESCVTSLAVLSSDHRHIRDVQQAAWQHLLPLFDPEQVRKDWLSGLRLQR